MDTASPFSALLSREKEKILACVHCGLCLESCPTYRATGDENDSPRGRVYLMRAVEEGKLKADSAAFERHIDRCLGCRACEQVCPSGVEYGNLLEVSRAEICVAKKSRSIADALLSWLLRYIWPYPRRLGLLLWSARVFRELRLSRLALRTGILELFAGRLSFALALLEASRPVPIDFTISDGAAADIGPEPATDVERKALLFKGCVTAGLFGRVNEATVRVLRANGLEADVPAEQTCCGALHLHSGDIEGARKLARRNLRAFGSGDSLVITNAGGCGAMLIGYVHLLADDPEFFERARFFAARVKDIGQVVDIARFKNEACRLKCGPATYDASCHLLNGQHASGEALEMTAAAVGRDLVPLVGSDVCCGGAGVYNLLEPKLSSRILDEKLDNIESSGAKLLATGNPGCHMQISAGAMLRGLDLKVCHPVEIVDAFYDCAGKYAKDA